MTADSGSLVTTLCNKIAELGDDWCILQGDASLSYLDLDTRRRQWLDLFEAEGVSNGDVIAIASDYSLDSVALLLAVLSKPAVAVMAAPDAHTSSALDDACATVLWHPRRDGALVRRACRSKHPLIEGLRSQKRPGFVIFTSGTSQRPRAVLHDADRFLSKFQTAKKRYRTLAFLRLDHIAGLDTLFYTLFAGGSLVVPESRDPAHVAEVMERHRVEVLPTSPTFLTLLVLSGAYERRDLSSLRIVTYGSEPMPRTTLDRVNALLPDAEIIQKYGTSEFGSPRSRSRARDSLWLDLSDPALEVKVVDGILWLRSPSAMLGYLNAPNPIDEEGWYCTGDRVEQEGHWLRILGRDTDIINVGGEKVSPEEVEAILMELEWVEDVIVRGAPNPISGQVVEAVIRPRGDIDRKEARLAVRKHCLGRLRRHEIPVLVDLTDRPLTSARQKKLRRVDDAGSSQDP